ncbi:TrkH family potassium uptake protein [Salidesulfovibrio brasiliensis]|uniref:TrkH family potassium uptake protein n=1 Tax=Salidesulfovibrio brasiliensis TaxID=221711 RepID=UPI0006D2083B|nr:potassium transporter TrkG [Salidesulfovibrio brasiliensis]
MRTKLFSPFWLPIYFFAAGIAVGTVLLHLDAAHPGKTLSWVDSLFTATSAICVTGLIVVDTGSFFSPFGQGIILLLIQLGGLGIMTYTSLVLYLLGQRISLTDRMAVGYSLLHDPTFSLRDFLFRVVIGTFLIEAVGAVALWSLDPEGFAPGSAVFHSVSAFCNAGFSLQPDSLVRWKTDWAVNGVFMLLIVLGGLGFAVLNELANYSSLRLRGKPKPFPGPYLFSWHTSVVLKTTGFLIVAGGALILIAELAGGDTSLPWHEKLLTSLFTSITCRTAGFNTVEIGGLTNVSLVLMLVLMLIGGSPGSCAGGLKTTTFRAIWGFIVSQFHGSTQTRVGRFALDPQSMNRVFTLIIFAMFIVGGSVLLLEIFEGGDVPHEQLRGHFLDTLFEVVSAFATVGLSTGITDKLTNFGKTTIVLLMFVGRLGPIWLLSALQSWQQEPHYRLPEDSLPLG